MIRAYGSQIVWGDVKDGLKSVPTTWIRAYGSRRRHLKKCQLSPNLFETCRCLRQKAFRKWLLVTGCLRQKAFVSDSQTGMQFANHRQAEISFFVYDIVESAG